MFKGRQFDQSVILLCVRSTMLRMIIATCRHRDLRLAN